MHISILWLIAGIALCALEAAIGPGIGIFFAGLAAIAVGALVALGGVAEDAYTAQGAWFFAFTVFCAALLWKPLQHFRAKKQGYNNIVGDTAEVIDAPLMRGHQGKVRWSGTIMLAELAPDAPESVPAGAKVVIVAAVGNRLIVK